MYVGFLLAFDLYFFRFADLTHETSFLIDAFIKAHSTTVCKGVIGKHTEIWPSCAFGMLPLTLLFGLKKFVNYDLSWSMLRNRGQISIVSSLRKCKERHSALLGVCSWSYVVMSWINYADIQWKQHLWQTTNISSQVCSFTIGLLTCLNSFCNIVTTATNEDDLHVHMQCCKWYYYTLTGSTGGRCSKNVAFLIISFSHAVRRSH